MLFLACPRLSADEFALLCLGGVVFIKEVPKSPSGKILRKNIRQWAAAEQSAGDPRPKL